MNTTRPSAAEQNAAMAGGITMLLAATMACILALIDVRLAFVPLGAVALTLVGKALGIGAAIPREKIGWLYTAVIFLTCWAPSLGTVGTVARFGLAGIVLATLVLMRTKNEPRLPTLMRFGMAILVLSLLISCLGAASTGYGIARLLNWVMFIPLLWLAYYRPNPRGIVFGIVLTGIFQMVGVGLQMAGLLKGTWGGLLTSGMTYNPETSTWLTRYTGFILNPNNLALVLACGVIVLAACILSKIPRRLKLVCIALIGLFAFGIVASGSRGGLIAVGLGLFVLFLAAGRRGIVLGVLAVGAALVVVQVAASQELNRVIASFAEIISGADASATLRNGVWVARLAKSDEGGLFLGSGFGGYAPALFAEQNGLDIDPDQARRATVDNSWLKMLLESGIVGLAGMALVLLRPMFGSLVRSAGDRRLWGIVAGSVLVACIWRSASVDMLDQNPWNALFFLAAGVAAASYKKEPTAGLIAGSDTFKNEPAAGGITDVRPKYVRT